MSQALYRKWRPHLWDEVVGQEHVVTTIRNAIRGERVGHAYLLAGPRGTGKTTTARLLAKAVNCLEANSGSRPCDHCGHCTAVNEGRFLDLIEIDAASNTGVEDIRDLRDKINFSPSQGKYKVYIIDEVHMLSTAAFNALLKTLEEPPSHAIFILATTEVHKIPATVLSRCQRHEFRRIPVNDIVSQLNKICQKENLSVEADALTLIARQATGSMRDAISLLDQLTSTGEPVDLASAQMVLGTAASQRVIDLVNAVIGRNMADGLNCIHAALDNGTDARQFARQAVEYLRSLLMVRMNSTDQLDATPEQRTQMAQQAQAIETPRLVEAIRLFNSAASEGRIGWFPGLLLEIALVESMLERAPAQAVQSVPVQTAIQPQTAAHSPQTPHISQTIIPTPQLPAQPPPFSQPDIPAAVQPAQAPSQQLPESQPARQEQPLAPPTPDSITLNDINAHWKRVREMVKRHRGQTDGLLNSCKLLTFSSGILTLGFASDVVKSKMEDDNHLDLTRAAISQVMGFNIQINCVVLNAKSNPLDPAAAADSDGLVSEALNLGGKIINTE